MKGGDVGNVDLHQYKSVILIIANNHNAKNQQLGFLKSGYQTAHPIFIISHFISFINSHQRLSTLQRYIFSV